MLFHGEIQSCADCHKYLYSAPGRVSTRGGRAGLPLIKVPRPPGSSTPCESCPKIPEGMTPAPESAEELTEQNYRAYLHYLECRAVGHWPDDPIVRRNARIIRLVEDAYDRQPMQKILSILGALTRGP